MSSFVLGDAAGMGGVIELAGGAIHTVSGEAAVESVGSGSSGSRRLADKRTWLVRTSHYLGPVSDTPNASSIERLRRAHDLVSSLPTYTGSGINGGGGL